MGIGRAAEGSRSLIFSLRPKRILDLDPAVAGQGENLDEAIIATTS